VDGTTGVAHSAGAAVNHGVSARDFDEPNQFLNEGGTVTGPTIVDVNSSSTALRITQVGAGNALLVEDSANPDATPFVVNADGQLIVGNTTIQPVNNPLTNVAMNPMVEVVGNNATVGFTALRVDSSANPSQNIQAKARGDIGSLTAVTSGDELGRHAFQGYDGTNFRVGAHISAAVDGTPGTNDMPGRLVFSTTADGASSPTERLRITSGGNVGIGTSSPSSILHLSTDTSGSWINVQSGAAAGNINFRRSNTSVASPTIVSSGDTLGQLTFNGYDGSDYRASCRIDAVVDGTPGSSDMPGRLAFFTTPDGSSTPSERMRINSAGNVGIGTSSPADQLHIASDAANAVRVETNVSATSSGAVRLFKRRGTAASKVIVNNGDSTGDIAFYGYDGATDQVTALIRSSVDGAPGASDMPGRLTFWTSADGGVSLSERMRIDNAGLITGTGTSLGAWTAYTPTLGGTGWAIGNGTVEGRYCQIGKIVHFRAKITFGSTSTAGAGAGTVSLPVAAGGDGFLSMRGLASFFDASATSVLLGDWRGTGTTTAAVVYRASNLGAEAALTTTDPFTWATSDQINISGTYEAS